MNKKTFGLAVIFFCVSSVWLTINIFWVLRGLCSKSGLLIPVLLFLAGVGVICNEFNKKKRKHISDVNKNQIP